MKISKKWKYALLGLGVAAIVIIPTVSVVSCAEIVKNSATNNYSAFSTVNAYSVNDNGTGSSSEDSVINKVALGGLLDNADGIRGAISKDEFSNLSSVTSWSYNENGELEGLASSSGNTIGYKKGLSDNSGITSSLDAPDWLQQNNTLIVQQLFTSLLNYLVGPITLYNYLGQQILEWSGTSAGTLRMLTGMANGGQQPSLSGYDVTTGATKTVPNDQTHGLFTDMMGYAPKGQDPVNIGSFANDLVHPILSKDGQTTYYLYPTDIFYHVQKADLGQTATNLWLDQSGNSKYSSILAAYMPSKVGGNEGSGEANGKYVKYDDNISVAEVSGIKIVFEFYCSSASNSDYQSDQPWNCTMQQNITNYATTPQINGNDLSYNPFYHRYIVLNLNPIYVSLQNIGLGKSTSKSTQENKDKTGPVDLTNYAALNYYNSQNLLAYYSSEKSNNVTINYNCINKDGTQLISTHPGFQDANNDYVNYYNTAAAAWCFSNDQITNLYEMQQQINTQALFFEQIASIDINSTNSNLQQISYDQTLDILKYINGDIAHS